MVQGQYDAARFEDTRSVAVEIYLIETIDGCEPCFAMVHETLVYDVITKNFGSMFPTILIILDDDFRRRNSKKDASATYESVSRFRRSRLLSMQSRREDILK